jgi:hypothetical protein
MGPRVLYKYRGIEPWEFLLDILVHKRLFAPSFDMLNDPMEGFFTYARDGANQSFIDRMMGFRTTLGICSLSKIPTSTVMWSYYAASHKGLVRGVEVRPDEDHMIQDIEYTPENVFRPFRGSNAETEARGILSKKFTAWSHEQEVRVFSTGRFVPVTLRSIHFGCQMAEPH